MRERFFILGYNGRYNDDGFPVPGDLIRIRRKQLRLTQEELASLLGCDRTMVAKMETENKGLDSITTRRQVAGALGILPAAFGLLKLDDVKTQTVYDTSLLKKTLQLHKEVYFSGGNTGGTQNVDEMTTTMQRISKEIDHKNRDLLETLCQYYQLGLDLAREEGDIKKINRYARNALSIGKALNDPVLLSSALARYCAALHEQGQVEKAKPYAREALSYVNVVPASLTFGIYTHVTRPFSSSHDTSVNSKKLLEKAVTIARSGVQDDDPGYMRPSKGFAQMWKAHGLIETGEYAEALDVLDLVNESARYSRRQCITQTLQARALLGTKEYKQAAITATSALDIALEIKSEPNKKGLFALYQELKQSPIAQSFEVLQLGSKFPKG